MAAKPPGPALPVGGLAFRERLQASEKHLKQDPSCQAERRRHDLRHTAVSASSSGTPPLIGVCPSYGRLVIRSRRTSGTVAWYSSHAAALVLWLGFALVVSPAPTASAAEPPSGELTRLSRPGTLSHWAFVDRRVAARARPDADARVVGRLKLKTEDGTDELVMALASTTDEEGRE